MKKLLSLALEMASSTSANGYEIDEFILGLGMITLSCGDDIIAVVKDQDVEIDSDGCAVVPNLVDTDRNHEDDPEMVNFEFKVLRPLSAADF